MKRDRNSYNRVISQIIPHGTRRRYYYELGKSGLAIIRKEGWPSFFIKVKQFIKSLPFGYVDYRYREWIKRNEPGIRVLERQKQQSLVFSYRPKISILTPVWNTGEKWLRLAIESVINQTYDNWELCLVDGGSSKPYIKTILLEFANKDARIKVKFLDENKGIANNSNTALSMATGELITLLDHDDELASFAFFEVVKLINEHPDTDFIYSDEDKISDNGRRSAPFFKPDWSPDTLLSCNYTCHLSVYRKTIVDSIGGFRSEYDGSQDYDFALRFVENTDQIKHIPKILYHWRIIPQSAASSSGAKPYAYVAAKKALTDYLTRNNIIGEVSDGSWLGSYRIKRLILGKPLVSIIIPSKDQVDILSKCIDSILNINTYPYFEIIIVDNQSIDKTTKNYYQELTNSPQIKIIRFDYPLNFSSLYNWASHQAKGEHLLFLNNDTEIISTEALSAMLEHSQRSEIGMVGAMLLSPNGSLQHSGIILGAGSVGTCQHVLHQRYDTNGYFGRARIINNISAVTGACMMLRKSVFFELNGFDENLPHLYNDVDLCIRLRQKGYFILYTPYANLFYHEFHTSGYRSQKRTFDISTSEHKYFLTKWGNVLSLGDPYYNINLRLDTASYQIREDEYNYE
jgi:O-antigen biosynthesis protein